MSKNALTLIIKYDTFVIRKRKVEVVFYEKCTYFFTKFKVHGFFVSILFCVNMLDGFSVSIFYALILYNFAIIADYK